MLQFQQHLFRAFFGEMTSWAVHYDVIYHFSIFEELRGWQPWFGLTTKLRRCTVHLTKTTVGNVNFRIALRWQLYSSTRLIKRFLWFTPLLTLKPKFLWRQPFFLVFFNRRGLFHKASPNAHPFICVFIHKRRSTGILKKFFVNFHLDIYISSQIT